MGLPVLHVPPGVSVLPDNRDWTNRLEIKSESSDRLYIISQHKTKRHFACSCPSYRVRRECKHLKALSLPCHEKPYEVSVQK